MIKISLTWFNSDQQFSRLLVNYTSKTSVWQQTNSAMNDCRRPNCGSKILEDNPPHSRLFIIGGKSLIERDFYKAFGEFGTVESVQIKKKDRGSVNFTYVKFSKTSEAADALEELNGKSIGMIHVL